MGISYEPFFIIKSHQAASFLQDSGKGYAGELAALVGVENFDSSAEFVGSSSLKMISF